MRKYILLLIGLLFFIPKVHAIEDYNNYFNLLIPNNYTDIIDYTYGSNTKIIDIKNELDSYQNNYYNYAIFHYMTASYGLTYTYIYLIPLNNPFTVYNYASVGSSNTSYTLIFSTSGIRIGIQPSDSITSILNSSLFSSIKDCMENNNCSSSAPVESDYTGNIQYNINQGSFSNNRFKITNFDNSLDYDVDYLSVLYSSSIPCYAIGYTGSSSQYVRKIKFMGDEIEFYHVFPTYLDYISIPDNPVDPDDPVDPDYPIDTNVGVWKNYVPWFVSNDSEYGVLVNIYILFFIIGVGFSVYLFIKLINKNRW